MIQKHEDYSGGICEIVTNDGNRITLTPEHCMLVWVDGKEKLCPAKDIKAGMKLQTGNDKFTEVIDFSLIGLENHNINEVYNIVTPYLTIVVNNIVASTMSEDTAKIC